MPEIAEIARIVHFLRQHLVGKRIDKVFAIDDANVFGKVGTSGAEVVKSLKGRTIVSAGSQGKYFWMTLDKPPHPVMHFGMTGWIHIQGIQTAYTNYYKKMKPGEEDMWPPKFTKFNLETDGPSPVKMAYTDPRRFGRVRLVDCPGADIRKFSPLVENGPDPDVDRDIFTQDFFTSKLKARHVPIKAILLDQAFISGIGNWVGDEILYQARVHPEQYSDTFSDAQLKSLYEAVCHVCRFAIEKLGDSDQFPEDWLFHYRWGKGSKSAPTTLPSGEKLAFVEVGGRTSCFVPTLQKKTGAVAPGAKEEMVDSKEPIAPKKAKAVKSGKVPIEEIESKPPTKAKAKRKRSNSDAAQESSAPTPKASKSAESKGVKKEESAVEDVSAGRRRSRRLEGK